MRADDITAYGFTWGPLTVERTAELPEERRVLTIKTPRRTIEVYVTATGLVRVFSRGKEWKP